MIDFIYELSESRYTETPLPFFPEKVKGYTDDEISIIAEKYNLNIQGQFKEFLKQMGRCSGGLLWGGSFPMYDSYWNLSNFEAFQLRQNDDSDYQSCPGSRDTVEGKAFYLDHENEFTSFNFLFTADNDDFVTVYAEDENRIVEKTVTLIEHLKYYVFRTTKNARFFDFDWSEEQIEKMITGRLL